MQFQTKALSSACLSIQQPNDLANTRRMLWMAAQEFEPGELPKQHTVSLSSVLKNIQQIRNETTLVGKNKNLLQVRRQGCQQNYGRRPEDTQIHWTAGHVTADLIQLRRILSLKRSSKQFVLTKWFEFLQVSIFPPVLYVKQSFYLKPLAKAKVKKKIGKAKFPKRAYITIPPEVQGLKGTTLHSRFQRNRLLQFSVLHI